MLKRFSSFAAVLSVLILTVLLVSCGESITTPLSSTQTPPVTASPVDSGAVTTEKNPDTNPECAHEMTEKIIPPSCTQGYTLHYCKKCSYSYSDSFVEAVGHSYKDVITPPPAPKRAIPPTPVRSASIRIRIPKLPPRGIASGNTSLPPKRLSPKTA